MFAHCQPGLSTADYKRVNLFNRHAVLHRAMPGSRFCLIASACIRVGPGTA
jgi:hypothetical protein